MNAEREHRCRRPGDPATQGPRAWLPLGFVIGALALLVATPFITSRRVARIRERVTDVTNEARILLSEFEGAFAEELVIASAGPDSRLPGRLESGARHCARARDPARTRFRRQDSSVGARSRISRRSVRPSDSGAR